MLDLVTALVLCSSMLVTVAAVLLVVWWRHRDFPAGIWWGAGFAAMALSTALIAARGRVPDVLSIEIANTMALGGLGCWIAGVAVFRERPVRLWVLVPALAWVAGMCVPQIRESLAMRMSLFNGAAAIGFGALAILIWPGWRDKSTTRRPLAFICFFQAGNKLTSAVIAQIFPPSDLATYPYASITAVIALILLILVVVYGVRLVLERAEEKLRLLAYTDPLTQALNRRGLIERYDNMVAAHRGSDRSIALLAFDLDHFKRINDRYGHLAGDAALASFARLATACLRQDDAFGRLGGEEFGAILAVSHPSEAATVAEHVRAALAAQPVMFGRVRIEVTVSVGIATMPADRANFDALMSAADRTLYFAKVGGRNQTRTDASASDRSVVTPLPRKVSVSAPTRLPSAQQV